MTNSDCLPATISALASIIAKDRSDEEIGLLAAMFVQLGDSLAAILAIRACNK